MHGGCRGGRPRDWPRFEREMRVWGRKFERDMCAMGERFEQDMEGAFSEGGQSDHRDRHASRRSGFGYRRGWRPPKPPRPPRPRWGRWTRDGAYIFAFGARSPDRREDEAGGGCASGARCFGGFHVLWLFFPLFFVGPGILRSMGGSDGVSASVVGGVTALLNYTLAAPIARLLSETLGVSFLQGYGLLMLSAAVSILVALIGLRAGRPAR